MKEYTIKMNFSVESKHSDFEDITIFAEELAEKIMEDDILLLLNKGNIEIVDATVEDVEDHNEDFEDDFNEDDY